MTHEALDLWLESTWNQHIALRLRVTACLHQSTSPFQRIEVFDSQALGRVLCLGGTIVLSENDEPVYSEGLVHPALQCHPHPKHVLILGGGDGGVCRQVLRYPGVESVTVVELDQAVVDVAQLYFPTLAASFEDPRVQVVVDDGYRFLESQQHAFDVIIVDADQLHDPSADLVHATSMPRLLANSLTAHGIAIAPLGLPGFAGDACRQSLAGLSARFTHVHPYQISAPSVLGHQWIVAWCSHHGTPQRTTQDCDFQTDLRFWDPALHDALFVLARPVREQLGLS